MRLRDGKPFLPEAVRYEFGVRLNELRSPWRSLISARIEVNASMPGGRVAVARIPSTAATDPRATGFRCSCRSAAQLILTVALSNENISAGAL